MDRRSFFNALGRYSLLAGLAAIAGVALWRNASGQGQKCPQEMLCRQCGQLDRCELDKAKGYKEALNQRA